ncbi:hypothetical protein V1520DRAFT_57467 [Lipomyces starkeyi]|uniref:Uncharacterized protein n=1 Tax=Lipomyces starkeyi NRRL Y-11557 TaxID=675824 RepID=A0A1E3PWF0_LIPST|nr:hypothetical protein LIPSTDRAFT_191496 [Lipomyces starkeyi NRRL Y-11557]
MYAFASSQSSLVRNYGLVNRSAPESDLQKRYYSLSLFSPANGPGNTSVRYSRQQLARLAQHRLKCTSHKCRTMAYGCNGQSGRRNANTYGFETGPYSTPDRVHSFAPIRTSNGAHYPSWCMTFFLFAFFQAIFAIIPLGVVAYFISLVRRHNMNAGVPQPYVILISAATITSVVILLSTLAILRHFRNTGFSDSHLRNDGCELEDEGNMEVGGGTIDIDIKAPGYLWPCVFVMSQIFMSLLWIGIFVYIMLLSGGISTACAIPNADKMCTGVYKETCQSYVTACHLGNLIVVSCALDSYAVYSFR